MINSKGILPGRIVAGILFCVALFIVAYKAIHIPITHDEKSATVYYPTFTVWQIMMYPDCWPSNHILNSLCIKLSEHFLGIRPWTVRLHSVVSFILFYWIICLIAVRYFRKTWILFCLPFFVMFCNPFLLDFYSLARGYGLSNMMMACSVYGLLRFSSSLRWRWYFLSIAFAMLAAYANFTLLIYWAAVQVLLVVLQIAGTIKNKRPVQKTILLILFTAILSAAFIALCYQPLYKMQSTNQFVYWSSNGFFSDTLLNQIAQFNYGVSYFHIPDIFIAWAVTGLLVLTGIYIIYKLKVNAGTAFSDPLVVVFLLLIIVWLVNMAQSVLLGTPFLTTRTALSYYVLFAFVLMFLLRDISEHIRWTGYTAVPLVIVLFGIHLSRTASLKYVREWWFDANTYSVLNYLKDYQQKHPDIKTIDLNTNWIFNPSFGFYSITGKTPWLNLTAYHKETDTASKTLFYYAIDDEASQLRNYYPVASYPRSNSVLLMRKPGGN